MQNKKSGQIAWIDLTVPDADKTRQFYENVTGWKSSPVSMGDYNDYIMVPEGGDTPAAGICHNRGVNADIPAQWLIYIMVDDLDKSLESCKKEGGKVITKPKQMDKNSRYAVIADPSGSVCALYETE